MHRLGDDRPAGDLLPVHVAVLVPFHHVAHGRSAHHLERHLLERVQGMDLGGAVPLRDNRLARTRVVEHGHHPPLALARDDPRQVWLVLGTASHLDRRRADHQVLEQVRHKPQQLLVPVGEAAGPDDPSAIGLHTVVGCHDQDMAFAESIACDDRPPVAVLEHRLSRGEFDGVHSVRVLTRDVTARGADDLLAGHGLAGRLDAEEVARQVGRDVGCVQDERAAASHVGDDFAGEVGVERHARQGHQHLVVGQGLRVGTGPRHVGLQDVEHLPQRRGARVAPRCVAMAREHGLEHAGVEEVGIIVRQVVPAVGRASSAEGPVVVQHQRHGRVHHAAIGVPVDEVDQVLHHVPDRGQLRLTVALDVLGAAAREALVHVVVGPDQVRSVDVVPDVRQGQPPLVAACRVPRPVEVAVHLGGLVPSPHHLELVPTGLAVHAAQPGDPKRVSRLLAHGDCVGQRRQVVVAHEHAERQRAAHRPVELLAVDVRQRAQLRARPLVVQVAHERQRLRQSRHQVVLEERDRHVRLPQVHRRAHPALAGLEVVKHRLQAVHLLGLAVADPLVAQDLNQPLRRGRVALESVVEDGVDRPLVLEEVLDHAPHGRVGLELRPLVGQQVLDVRKIEVPGNEVVVQPDLLELRDALVLEPQVGPLPRQIEILWADLPGPPVRIERPLCRRRHDRPTGGELDRMSRRRIAPTGHTGIRPPAGDQ